MLALLLAIGSPATAAQFVIAATANAGGTVEPLKGKIPVEAGGSKTVTFRAAAGYYLAEVKVNALPVQLTDFTTFSREFTNVTQNQAIAARFAKNPTINATSNAGGTVTPKGKVVVAYGGSQSFTVTPAAGFHIVDVVADGVSKGAAAEVPFSNVREPHTVKATFAANTYTVTTSAGSGGSISAGFTAVKHGQLKPVIIKPATGMKIASVTVNGAPVEGLPLSGPYTLNLTVTQNIEVAATFAEAVSAGTQRLKGKFRIVVQESGLNNPTSGTASLGGSINGSLITASFDGNGGCTITSNSGYGFHSETDISGKSSVVTDAKNDTPA
ncbi:MAG TPA: hypothetical protein VNX25_01805, partial [Verrucomicrobiae bacterium]|nr:hypothetical protein [Verrucomicrobiae bacterium]